MLDKVEAFLQAQRLSYEKVEENLITTGFTIQLRDGSDHVFPLFIMGIEDLYGDSYVRLTIVPFVDQPYDGYPAELYMTVGQINHDLPRLKFAFDADGDLELICDLPGNDLGQPDFERTVQILADYASDYYPELVRGRTN